MHVSITCHSACSSCTSPHLPCLFSPILPADWRSMAIGERRCYATKTAESNLAQTTKAIKVAALPAAPPPVVLSTFLPLSLPPLRCISPPHVSIVCVLQPAQASCMWQIQTSCVCPFSKCSSKFFICNFHSFPACFPDSYASSSFPFHLFINFLSNFFVFNWKYVGKNIFTTCIQISSTQCMWPDNLLLSTCGGRPFPLSRLCPFSCPSSLCCWHIWANMWHDNAARNQPQP